MASGQACLKVWCSPLEAQSVYGMCTSSYCRKSNVQSSASEFTLTGLSAASSYGMIAFCISTLMHVGQCIVFTTSFSEKDLPDRIAGQAQLFVGCGESVLVNS